MAIKDFSAMLAMIIGFERDRQAARSENVDSSRGHGSSDAHSPHDSPNLDVHRVFGLDWRPFKVRLKLEVAHRITISCYRESVLAVLVLELFEVHTKNIQKSDFTSLNRTGISQGEEGSMGEGRPSSSAGRSGDRKLSFARSFYKDYQYRPFDKRPNGRRYCFLSLFFQSL